MSDYQGKRFKASQIPDPSKPGAAHAAQQGRTSSPQQPRAPRPVTPATHRRQDAPAAYRPSSYSNAKKPPRASSHAAPSDYTEPPRKKRRSIIPILLIIIGIGLIVAAAAIFINAQIGYKQASDSYQKIEKQLSTSMRLLRQTPRLWVGFMCREPTSTIPSCRPTTTQNTSTRCSMARPTHRVPSSWITRTLRPAWWISRLRSTATI